MLANRKPAFKNQPTKNVVTHDRFGENKRTLTSTYHSPWTIIHQVMGIDTIHEKQIVRGVC